MLESEFIAATEPRSTRLLIALHGLGDSVAGYRWLPGELGLPWLNYLLVNAPDPYYGGFSWYDIFGVPGPGIERSRQLLAELLGDQERKGFPPSQTVLFGFSQGCVMILDVGVRCPKPLAGLVGISGYIHDAPQTVSQFSGVARGLKILMTHGTEDTLLPIDPVRRQVELWKQNGLDITWKEYAKAHTVAGAEEVALIRSFIQSCFDPAPNGPHS